MTLELLPTEVRIQIMSLLESPKDAYALIRASPALLQMFLANKGIILNTISRKAFHPCVLLEALSIARLQELSHPLPWSNGKNLLKTPIEERRTRLFSTTSVDQSMSVCRLCNLIEFFIGDYATYTIPILDHLEAPVMAHFTSVQRRRSKYHLSATEYARLQRAFSRFELYCKLFGKCKPDRDCFISHKSYDKKEAATAEEQAILFLLQYSEVEITEIHCIRDYVYHRLRGIFDLVEDLAVKNPRSTYYELGNSCATGSRCPYPFAYHGHYHRDEHMAHLASLGLGYLRRIIEVQGDDERTELMLHGSYTCCGPLLAPAFLDEGLGLDILRAHDLMETYTGVRGSWSDSLDQNDILSPSPRWTWRCRDRDASLPVGSSDRLRDWGFVFWDLDRLRDASVLDQE